MSKMRTVGLLDNLRFRLIRWLAGNDTIVIGVNDLAFKSEDHQLIYLDNCKNITVVLSDQRLAYLKVNSWWHKEVSPPDNWTQH